MEKHFYQKFHLIWIFNITEFVEIYEYKMEILLKYFDLK